MISGFVLNHLWQSTIFSAAVVLLILLFRKNHARIRHALWLAASVKFLIPFSLFIAIGNSIDFGERASGIKMARPVVTLVENASQPFGLEKSLPIVAVTTQRENSHLQEVAFSIWLCGFLAVLLFYLKKGRRVRAAVRAANPIIQGRSFEALQRLMQTSNWRARVQLASSDSSLEPGVFGVFHPVLLLPEGMEARLDNAQMEAIIAHELAHIRRSDNLIAAIHMFIEALFWFHPMIWWLGAKLVQEREKACDEEVLRMGKDPQTYAEGILKVCEFCLESPLACVAGITGSDMKKRVHEIMCHHIGSRVGWAKKLFLAGAAFAALAVPITIGFLNAPSIKAQTQRTVQTKKPIRETPPAANSNASSVTEAVYVPTMTFDVASVRETQGGDYKFWNFSPPNSSHLMLINNTLLWLVAQAYGVQDSYRVEGVPRELESATFNVEAKSDSATDERLAKLTKEQVRLEQRHMLQTLLAERFKLKAHWETRNGDAYDLVVAKAGKLKSTGAAPSAEELKYLSGRSTPRLYQAPIDFTVGKYFGFGSMYIGHEATIADIAHLLNGMFKRPVVDKTGLTGKYDFTIKTYRVRLSEQEMDDPFPPVEKAIQDELGLKLVPSQGMDKKLIIDHIEKPSEN